MPEDPTEGWRGTVPWAIDVWKNAGRDKGRYFLMDLQKRIDALSLGVKTLVEKSTDVTKFNPCHSPKTGEFCSTGGGSGSGSSQSSGAEAKAREVRAAADATYEEYRRNRGNPKRKKILDEYKRLDAEATRLEAAAGITPAPLARR